MNLLINGLITGAVFAIAASGLVVTYSTSGVFNFAHGALGMLCAYVYWDLRVNDSHTWPLLPKGHWPAPLALGFVLLVFAPLLGALLYRVVIRGLQDTSEIVKLVVPISVLLAAIGLANWVWKPTDTHSIQPFFGADHKVTVFGVVLLWHDLTILLVAIALAVALRVLLYRTRVGVSMRAVVDDRPLVELNGARPDRVSLVSWMIGVSLSALAGILITPFQGGSLSSTLLTLLVINAFAAAMFGRLRNLPLTFVGAVVLGFATRMAFERPTGLMPKTFDWGGNLRLAVPMILLFVVLLVLPQDRLRGAVPYRTREHFSLPTMTSAYIGGAVFVVCIFLLSRIMAASPLLTLSDAIAAAIIILSLVVLVGYAGEVSLATMALAGIGGTVLYHHVGHGATSRAGIAAFAIAIVATALVGAVIALPALRLRGLYLALATAAFSLAVEQMLFKEYAAQRRIYPATLILLVAFGLGAMYRGFSSHRLRGALVAAVASGAVITFAATNPWLQREQWSAIFPNGSLQVPRPQLFGIDFSPQDNFLLLLATVFAVLGVSMIALRRSAYGRRLTAMKNSPAAGATLGLNIVRLKLSVFMISAAIAGLGGCLFAQEVGAVTSDRFSLFESMTMLMLLVVAGAGYVSGGLTAGLLYGAVFVALESIFAKIGNDYSAFQGWSAWLVHFTALLPALIGIGLGRNPSGFLNDVFEGFGAMIREARVVFFAGVASELLIWFLAFRHAINNWTFAILTIALAVMLPRVARLVKPAPGHTAAPEPNAPPLELIGIDRAFTVDDLREMNRGIGLDSRTGLDRLRA
ncbi:MAG: branched-chain amino acid transport system permease protein livM [Actinomycetota bacterium]|nr:branched-chain amino acid transport system permease protein livM [Actinomycetota bacterium]